MTPYKVKTVAERVEPSGKGCMPRFRWFMDCHQPFFCVVGPDHYATTKSALCAAARIRKRLGLVAIKAQQTFEDVAPSG